VALADGLVAPRLQGDARCFDAGLCRAVNRRLLEML
jgi:hypothetical protein